MKMRKIIAIAAAALMLLSILPISAMAADAEIVFEFGANGSASHADGSEKSSYSETNGDYTFSYSGASKVYTGARDAKGNSCLKLGTSSAVGKFSFTVPGDVNAVVIKAAKYKSNTTKLTVAGTTYTLTKNSNDGAYDEITVDTTSTKTISVTTVSGGARAMINSITYMVSTGDAECPHEFSEATCTEASTCTLCGAFNADALGHDWEIIEEVEATCTADGSITYECAACGEDKEESIPAISHNYVDGACEMCDAEQPLEATLTFDAASKRITSTSTQQVWQENGITMTYNKGSYDQALAEYEKPARFYKGTQLIIAYPGMVKIEFYCNNTEYATAMKNSINGSTVSNKVVTIEFDQADTYTVAALSAQVRLDSIKVYAAKPGCKHEYASDCDSICLICGEETREAGHTYTDDCDSECDVCGEWRFDAPHNLTYVPGVVPANCLEEGYDEYWKCEDCKAYFGDAEASWQVNPGWMYYTGECTRPEGSIPCAVVECTVCGNDVYGEACTRPENAPVCQDAECVYCGETVWGWGCNYNTGDEEIPAPLCQPGECVYCGTHYEKLYDCENGSWAPCSYDGECSYGCGKQYPATGIHSFEDGVTACDGGTCWLCWNEIEAADHVYDNEFDTNCNVCGDVRESDVIACGGTSVSEDVRGVAVKFTVSAQGMGIDGTTAIYDNATINGYKLISMGAVADNGVSTRDIAAVYLCDDDVSAGATYAIRIKNIPEGKEDVEITFTPYFVVEIEGVATTIYGDAVTTSYNG